VHIEKGSEDKNRKVYQGNEDKRFLQVDKERDGHLEIFIGGEEG